MKQWYIERIRERLTRHFTRNFSRISEDRFVVGVMRYNYQCHLNAVHENYIDSSKKVVLTLAVDRRNDFIFLHFVNRLPNGRYQDNTLGSDANFHSYYFIKEVLPDQYNRIQEFFGDHRRDYIKMFSRHWLVRLLGIEPIDVF